MKKLVLLITIFISSCTEEAKEVDYKPVAFSEIPYWQKLDISGAATAFNNSCKVFITKNPNDYLHKNNIFGTFAKWQSLCTKFSTLELGDVKNFFEVNLKPYKVTSVNPSLITGYYESELAGSFEKTTEYNIPLHRLPSDLFSADLGDFFPNLAGKKIVARTSNGKLLPYYNRAEIESENNVILWLKNDIDKFFLQIQGSGKVKLPSGDYVRVNYAGDNGKNYVAIGKVLLDMGEIQKEDISLFSIKQWLQSNPKKAQGIMNSNPRYIFFRLSNSKPQGTLQVPLTPNHSVAVDVTFTPLGVPMVINTNLNAGGRFNNMVMAQDTGAAIKGVLRADIFFGSGVDAELKAGVQNSQGTFFVLVPRV